MGSLSNSRRNWHASNNNTTRAPRLDKRKPNHVHNHSYRRNLHCLLDNNQEQGLAMGAKDWLIKKFSGKSDLPKKTPQEKLEEYGIQTLSDEKLEHRIALMIDLEKEISAPIETADLKNYVKILKERTDKLNYGIMQIAAPYARAGTEIDYARKVRGWTQMYAIANHWIHQANLMLPQKAEDKEKKDNIVKKVEMQHGNIEVLIQMLHDNLEKFIWKDGFFLLGVCFKDPDVSPRVATVIQTMTAQRPGVGLNDVPEPKREY